MKNNKLIFLIVVILVVVLLATTVFFVFNGKKDYMKNTNTVEFSLNLIPIFFKHDLLVAALSVTTCVGKIEFICSIGISSNFLSHFIK